MICTGTAKDWKEIKEILGPDYNGYNLPASVAHVQHERDQARKQLAELRRALLTLAQQEPQT